MDNEEAKRASSRVPLTQLNQIDSDFALAMALQEQEEDDSESVVSDEEDDGEFSESGDVEGELEFMEGEDSSSSDYLEMEEDEIDPDELSYEELMALGEIVGEESRGLSADQISTCLHPYKCHSVKCKTGIDRCVICQVEYEEEEEENLVALPCEHSYHLDCISKWLQVRKICPICSTEVSPPKIARTT